MIPKIVHYIWFGKKPYPPKIQYCIKSWEKHLPNYKFMLWNEDSFDVNICKFTKEAFNNKKWAFVSDYVRIYALYYYGGWYLDTDVEIVRPLDSFENKKIVLGVDENGALTALMGSEKEHPFWKTILDKYNTMNFILKNGEFNMTVNNIYIQEELSRFGYVIKNEYQELKDGIYVYPDDYFHVAWLEKGKTHFTKNTYAIHWHTLLWTPKKSRYLRSFRLSFLRPLFGEENFMKVYNIITNSLKKITKK